jgi:hypothetical protein
MPGMTESNATNGPDVIEIGRVVVSLVAKYYSEHGGIHPPTLIGAMSALTGKWVLRATGLPLPAKGWVVGDEINQQLFEGKVSAWGLMKHLLRTNDIMTEKDLGGVANFER